MPLSKSVSAKIQVHFTTLPDPRHRKVTYPLIKLYRHRDLRGDLRRRRLRCDCRLRFDEAEMVPKDSRPERGNPFA